MAIHPDHVDLLVNLIANRAGETLLGTPQAYFTNLVRSSHLPQRWVVSIAGRWTGNATYDARNLVDWAIGQKINPADPSFTTLGSVLRALLGEELSPDDATMIVAILVGYGLILDKKKLDDLKIRYGVPVKPAAAAPISYGPDFEWLGPDTEIELQGFFTPEPPWQDVGFLRRAIECASSVCRVEIGDASGTGFVVAPRRVLTNYHVLKLNEGDNLEENAKNTVLRFAAYTTSAGKADDGITFKLDLDQAILAQSPVKDLDYVLLNVESRIMAQESIKTVSLDADFPAAKSPLNILHHPGGDTMKLSTSGNGVTGVYGDKGLIQYATQAAEGSSGSPCFTDDWKVVALHHAQKARAFGCVREGILIKNILAQIQPHLDN